MIGLKDQFSQMKYFVLIPDGAADEPQESLGGKSPLEYASLPTLDRLAGQGRVGLTNHVPESCAPGSEVACRSLMGYDPLQYLQDGPSGSSR